MKSWLVTILLGFTALSASAESRGPYAHPYEFSPDARWHRYHVKRWSQLLGPFEGRADLRYLEIGVFEGGSFLWMLDNILTHESSEAVAVDLFPEDAFASLGNFEQRFRDNVELSGAAPRVTILKGRSQDVLRDLPRDPFDIIYIDGSHTANDTMIDAVLAWQLLETGGILLLDDYQWRPELAEELRPQVALDAFITAFRNEIAIVDRGYQLVLRKRPPPCLESLRLCTRVGAYIYDFNGPELLTAGSKQTTSTTPEGRFLLERWIRLRRFGEIDLQLPDDLRAFVSSGLEAYAAESAGASPKAYGVEKIAHYVSFLRRVAGEESDP